MSGTAKGGAPAREGGTYITVTIGGQLFGLPILAVQDVFVPAALTAVPLAAPEVAGILNLRGRIVTVIDMRRRLGLGPRGEGETGMAVGVSAGGESYGLIVDDVGDLLVADGESFESSPVHLDARWADIAIGVHRLDDRLLVVLDVDRVLALDAAGAEAA